MKNLITTLFAICFTLVTVLAQDGKTVMVERTYLKPKLGMAKKFNEGMTSHNKKYHASGQHSAFVQFIATGKWSGYYAWAMGPTTFSALDNRPADDAHNEDWDSNVLAYTDDMGPTHYWVRDDEQYNSPDGYDGTISRARLYRVKTGKGDRFAELFGNIVRVYKEKNYGRPIGLYWNQFPTSYGPNAATVTGVNNWASYDEDGTFAADFNSIFGAGAFGGWLAEWRDCYEWQWQRNGTDHSGTGWWTVSNS